LVAFSRDGKLAFFDQPSGRVLARDTRTWKKTGQLLVNETEIGPRKSGPVVVSPDGRLRAYATTSYEKQTLGWGGVTVEDAKTKATLAKVAAAHRKAPLLLFTPDGKTLISAASDAVILWDVPALKRRRTLGPVNSDPRGLVLSPDGGALGVTCGRFTGEDQIWDLKAGKMRLALGGHGAQVWSLAFSPDGKALVSSGNDPQLKFWDVASGMNTTSIPLHFDSRTIKALAFGPDGKRVAAGEGSLVRLFDAKTGRPALTLKGHTGGVNALAFSPDGKQLASASGRPPAGEIGRPGEPGEVILWDLEAGKARHVWKAHPLGALAVAWAPGGAHVATGGALDPSTFQEKKNDPARAIFLWDAKTGKLVKSFAVEAIYGINQLAFSPDGKWLVHDGIDGSRLRIVAVQTGKEVRTLDGGVAMAFRKDGRVLAVAGGAPGRGAIELREPSTGKLLARHFAHDAAINAVAFHPDGRSLATGGSDRVIWLWDLVPGKKK
jgi:WD40 repeat protein